MIKGHNLMDLAFFKCTATLLYIVLKKGDIIITLGNDNAGNFSKCVMLCSVNMILYKFHFCCVYQFIYANVSQ